MYDDADYANSRLRDTAVLWGAEPAYVVRVREDLSCIIRTNLENMEDKEVDINELNALALPLGFLNRNGRAHYLTRRPMREDWRQGLRPNQVRVLYGSNGVVNIGNIMQCMSGNYKSVEEAITLIQERDHRSVAISRKLCLERFRGAIRVVYCWKGAVGKVVEGAIVFNKGKEHLAKLLRG